MEFLATAAFGLEGLVKRELDALGFPARAEGGGARFSTDLIGAFRANLWLSCADRVLWVAGEHKALSFDDLFQFVQSIAWEDLLPRDAEFPVSGNCARSRLMSVRDCQRITKKAIAERMKRRHGLDRLPETGARFQVSVALHNDAARLTIDTREMRWNRRGYRTWVDMPLRETLAASMVRLSVKPGQALHDPCRNRQSCSSKQLFSPREGAWPTRSFALKPG